jgi:hypothetical protein
MRYSVHTFPVDLLLVATAATRRLNRKTNSYRKRLEGSYEKLADEVESALSDGPLPAVKIRERVDPENEIGDLFNVLLGMAAADNRIVRATTTGSWRSDRFLYARWQDWLPGTDPNGIDTGDAMRALVERYVAAYGPVDVEDVRWWAGWTKAETLEAIDGIDLGAAGTAADLLTGVRLLPVWDVLLVAYRNRDRLLDPGHTPLIYDRFGNATSAVLDGGRIVGQWDLGGSDDPLEIKVAPFFKWPKRRWNDVEVEAQRIGKLVGAGAVTVVPVDEPTDLLDSSRNRFLSPLAYR